MERQRGRAARSGAAAARAARAAAWARRLAVAAASTSARRRAARAAARARPAWAEGSEGGSAARRCAGGRRRPGRCCRRSTCGQACPTMRHAQGEQPRACEAKLGRARLSEGWAAAALGRPPRDWAWECRQRVHVEGATSAWALSTWLCGLPAPAGRQQPRVHMMSRWRSACAGTKRQRRTKDRGSWWRRERDEVRGACL